MTRTFDPIELEILLAEPDRHRQRAGPGAAARGVQPDRARGRRPRQRRVRPPRPDGRPGRHRHARPHQLAWRWPSATSSTSTRSTRSSRATCSITNDPYKTAGQLLDVTVLVPGVAQRPGDRLLRLDDPPHRRRRLRHRRRRPRRVRGGPVDPDRQADEAAASATTTCGSSSSPTSASPTTWPATCTPRWPPARSAPSASRSLCDRHGLDDIEELADEIIVAVRGGHPGQHPRAAGRHVPRPRRCSTSPTAARSRSSARSPSTRSRRDHSSTTPGSSGASPLGHQRRQELHPRLHDVHGALGAQPRAAEQPRQPRADQGRGPRGLDRQRRVAAAVHRPPRRRHVPAQRAAQGARPDPPEQAMAEGSGAVWTMQVSGNHDDGSPFITAMFTYAGGVGARADKPGLVACSYPTGVAAVPIEVVEASAPIRFHRKELRPGIRRRRRARRAGSVRRSSSPSTPPARGSSTPSPAGSPTPPEGIFGGEPGATGSFTVNGEAGHAPRPASRCSPATSCASTCPVAAATAPPTTPCSPEPEAAEPVTAATGSATNGSDAQATLTPTRGDRAVAARSRRGRSSCFEAPDGAVAEWTYGEFDELVARVATTFAEARRRPWRRRPPGAHQLAGVRRRCGSPPRRSERGSCRPTRMATAPELAGHIARTAPAVGLCAATRADAYRDGVSTGGLRGLSIVEVDETDSTPLPTWSPTMPTGTAALPASTRGRSPAVMFTSGTTGRPRASRSPRPTTRFAGTTMAAAAGLEADDRQLVVLPLFHANAQYYSFASAIAVGASVALMHTFSRQRLPRPGGPPRRHARQPLRRADADDPRPRSGTDRRRRTPRAASAALLVREEHHRRPVRDARRLARLPSPPAVRDDRDDSRRAHRLADRPAPRRHGLCHHRLPGRPPRRVGQPGRARRPWARSSSVASRASPCSPATSTTRPPPRPRYRGDWFRTGDRAWRDDERAVLLRRSSRRRAQGRRGERLRRRSRSGPRRPPDVLEVVVVGAPDPIRDEVPVAFVVPAGSDPQAIVDDSERSDALAQELDAWAAARLGKAKRPHRYVVVADLPRTSVGKIRKFLLTEAASRSGSDPEGDRSPPPQRGGSHVTSTHPTGARKATIDPGLLAELERSVDDVSRAVIPPAELYTSPEFSRSNAKHCSPTSGCASDALERIPNPGDYFTVTICDEPIIVARDKDGEVHAMSAVCQHRGDAGLRRAGQLHSKFTCPYHHWSYDLDGRLLGAPAMERTEDFNKTDFPLPKLAGRAVAGLRLRQPRPRRRAADSDAAPLRAVHRQLRPRQRRLPRHLHPPEPPVELEGDVRELQRRLPRQPPPPDRAGLLPEQHERVPGAVGRRLQRHLPHRRLHPHRRWLQRHPPLRSCRSSPT